MQVEVLIAPPPMFEEIDRAFGVRGQPVVFTWGTRIYNPMGVKVPKQIMAHEAEHSGRQTGWTGENDEAKLRAWWERYIAEPEFRLEEEVHAHRAEYRWLAEQTKDRNARNRYLLHVAAKLAAPLYGRLLTQREAAARIRGMAAVIEGARA